jgi:hypothetical protein
MIKAVLILLLAAGTATADIRLALWDWLAADEAVPLTWAAAGLNEGLVSYWAMRTSGTTVFDEYGTNTGTAVNGVLFGSQYGVRDDGSDFDGVNDYMNIPHAASLSITGAITLSMWVQVKSPTGGNQVLLTKGSAHTAEGVTTGSPYQMIYSSAQFIFWLINASGNRAILGTGSGSVKTNEWQHVVGTWDGTTEAGNQKLYIDGTEVTNATQTVVSAMLTNTQNLCFGRRSATVNSSYHKGSLDEVAVWTRALSSNEVYNLYNTPLYAPYKE